MMDVIAPRIAPSNQQATGRSKGIATLEDYRNFHGMLCNPTTASRCIDSFDGCILFMPSTYTTSTLGDYDCTDTLNQVSYYLLVLLSLTGLSTLLLMTDFRKAKENFHEGIETEELFITSNFNSKLTVQQYALNYCMKYTNAKKLCLKRHFEYHFRLVGLEVIMLHFICDKGKLHLVEVYTFNNWICQRVLSPFLNVILNSYRNIFHKLCHCNEQKNKITKTN